MNLINLERALRKGKTPESLGAVEIGHGVQKKAYLYTLTNGKQMVIKSRTGGFGRVGTFRPPDLEKYNVKTIYQTQAGNYVIQEFVKPLHKSNDRNAWKIYDNFLDNSIKGDFHTGNFGVRDNGEVVVFDW